jgi:NAD-dependent SIR2 family protein deacetylase
MITSNGRIIKKTYCYNCFGIIMWDDVADEKSQMGHRMIQCPKCGKEE